MKNEKMNNERMCVYDILLF